MLDNRAILIPALALAAIPASAQKKGQAAKATAEDYNVIFIISDQMSARALPIYGNENIKTPNIERLACEGVQFMNSVCVVPTSSPARGSLLTGLYPMGHGILNNVNEGKGIAAISNDLPSPDKILFADGYQTAWFGKWHLGEIANYPCYHSSNDERKDFKGRYADMRRSARGKAKADPAPKGYVVSSANADQGYGFYQTEYMYNLTQTVERKSIRSNIGSIGLYGVPVELFNWTLVVKDGIDFIKANKDKRFMATISLGPPHPAFAICEPFYSMVDPAKIKLQPSWAEKSVLYADDSQYLTGQLMGEKGTREKMRCYYAQCLFIDEMIGRILSTLDQLDLTKKTLVVFTADHGDPMSSHGMLYGKSIDGLVEELVCTPALIRLPGVIPAGKKVQAHFHSADFAPTMLDYLGREVPASMQGRSFRSLIEGHEKDNVGFGYTMRPAGARNIRGEIDGRMYSYGKVFVLGSNSKTYEELYDLTADPYQLKNVIKDKKYAAVKARLISEYDTFNKRVGDQLIENLPQKGLLNYGNLRKDKRGGYGGGGDDE